MTQTPTYPTASAGEPGSGLGDVGYGVNRDTDANAEHPATRDAQARQTNAHRATYAAEALHHHTRASRSHAQGMQQALVELLTDLHHLCDTCDLDLAPLYEAATLIHTRETQAA